MPAAHIPNAEADYMPELNNHHIEEFDKLKITTVILSFPMANYEFPVSINTVRTFNFFNSMLNHFFEETMTTNITIKGTSFEIVIPPEFYEDISIATLQRFEIILKNGNFEIFYCGDETLRVSIVKLINCLGGLRNNTVILKLKELCDEYNENLKKSEE